MNATQIPQAIPEPGLIVRLQESGLDPALAKAWAQTSASLRQYVELQKGGYK